MKYEQWPEAWAQERAGGVWLLPLFLFSENVWEVNILIYRVGIRIVLTSQICFWWF